MDRMRKRREVLRPVRMAAKAKTTNPAKAGLFESAMSVGLLITSHGDGPRTVDEFIPLASQASFVQTYLPLAAALQLRWMPCF